MKSLIILIALLFSGMSYADHNSHLDGYSPDRGYNEASCSALESKTTGRPAEWLGHLVGCLIEEEDGYVLVMEYRVEKLDKATGDELRKMVRHYEKINEELSKPKGIAM